MRINNNGENVWHEVGLSRFYPASVGPDHSADTLCQGTRTTSQTYQSLVVAPIYSGPKGITINRWTINVATAVASAVYRIGVWRVDTQTDPFAFTAGSQYATLFRDVGAATATIDISTTGNKTLADTFTLPPAQWFVIGGATQGATGANLTIGTNIQGIPSPFGLFAAAAGIATGGAVGLVQTGVAGAFGNFVPTGSAAVGHGVGLRRSA